MSWERRQGLQDDVQWRRPRRPQEGHALVLLEQTPRAVGGGVAPFAAASSAAAATPPRLGLPAGPAYLNTSVIDGAPGLQAEPREVNRWPSGIKGSLSRPRHSYVGRQCLRENL